VVAGVGGERRTNLPSTNAPDLLYDRASASSRLVRGSILARQCDVSNHDRSDLGLNRLNGSIDSKKAAMPPEITAILALEIPESTDTLY
jgi:hypothetical protein